MGEYFVKRPLKRPPVHPGYILREDVLSTLGLSVSEAARRLGISRQHNDTRAPYQKPGCLERSEKMTIFVSISSRSCKLLAQVSLVVGAKENDQ
jgi:hypothetical protein